MTSHDLTQNDDYNTHVAISPSLPSQEKNYEC